MKNRHTGVFRQRLRLLAWVNICVQVCFPLAVTFTPLVMAADSSPQTTTQIWTLKPGETTASVATHFGISLDELRKLNQFRTFAHGFDHLKPGDELDVPLAATAQKAGGEGIAGEDDTLVMRKASIASQAGTFLASNPDGDAVASLARGMATGEASRQVQDWMSNFGTARVQLDADPHFSLKNSQFDLLVPLYEQQDILSFTQGSLHRTDDRTQTNVGWGMRWFAGDWMLGGNTFLDYDLSREHTRMGMGLEYWRDFLKLGANSYLRLSNWKDSPDLDDYQERPANGWDIRAQGWLPALPQLGARLVWEQYYGDEVALFDKDHRQRNPHAVTAGLEYTPVPLVTLSAEQRQGQSGDNDTRVGVDFRYQLGSSWQQQTDPDAVQSMRSLAGSRHDLVERNNNIVLEYRKKDTIRLHTTPLVTGYGGDKKSLGVTVNSRYGVARIEWSAPALLSAGGQIIQNGTTDYSVLLPAYHFSQGVNNYTVTGVAVDQKGNRSNSSETQVSVKAPDISKSSSTFTPASSTLPADGTSTQELTLTLLDAQGEPVDIPVSEVVINSAGQASSAVKHQKSAVAQTSAKVSEVTRKSAGVFSVTVTAGTKAETLILTPVAGDVTLTPAKVVISGNAPSATNSTLGVSKSSLKADGADTSTLTFTAKDASGNVISGIAGDITFRVVDSEGYTVHAPAVTVTSATESPAGSGIYTAALSGTLAGNYTVIPQYNGAAVGSGTGIQLNAGDTDGSRSTFSTPVPQSIMADNEKTSTLSFTAKDENGNTVFGLDLSRVTFRVFDSNNNPVTTGITVSATGTDGSGAYTAQLRGTITGTYTVIPYLDGAPVGSLSGSVTLTVGTPAANNSTIGTTGSNSITANGTDSTTVIFTPVDAGGHPVTDSAGSISF
ncbi:inverse autotransporter beta domain-containing protein, partial [Citrobacter koseri]|uniref:inverse autotransporter beta domain-containing protein n=1 Tax=Citrobacter koseri TaxID=545 RepID=UPI001F19AD58